jgi:hypothetical protein
MTTYDVTAWCSVAYYTTFEVEAVNIAEALTRAKQKAATECGEPCGGGESAWDEFEITAQDNSGECLRHIDLSRLAENAAEDLLQVLTEIALALRRDALWLPDTPGRLAQIAEAAIARATGTGG